MKLANGDSKAEETDTKKPPRIRSNDYQSWDTFDVVSNVLISMKEQKFCAYFVLSIKKKNVLCQAKALEEVDKEESPTESDSEEADQERALAEKEKVRAS